MNVTSGWLHDDLFLGPNYTSLSTWRRYRGVRIYDGELSAVHTRRVPMDAVLDILTGMNTTGADHTPNGWIGRVVWAIRVFHVSHAHCHLLIQWHPS